MTFYCIGNGNPAGRCDRRGLEQCDYCTWYAGEAARRARIKELERGLVASQKPTAPSQKTVD